MGLLLACRARSRNHSTTSVRSRSGLYTKHFPSGSSRDFLWLPSQKGAFFVRPHAQINMALSCGSTLIGPVALRRMIRAMVIFSFKWCGIKNRTAPLRQIFFAQKAKTFAKQNLTGKREVVNGNSHGWRVLAAQHHWIGEANIQLRAQ